MSREDASYDDAFDAAVNDDDFDIDIGNKSNNGREKSPIATRRQIESLLEERRLRKQLEDDYDFDDE